MTRWLVTLLFVSACTRSPEERAQRAAKTLQTELDAAASSYALFERLKQGLGTETRECKSSEQLPTTYRLSMAHLELLNGAPHKGGVLVVELPAPDGFDNLRGFPPRLIEPRDVSDAELDKLVRELRAAHAALKSADGFLVQRVDSYVPPVLRTRGFEPGMLTGRVIAFDGQGKALCHVPYEASGGSDAGVDLAAAELNRALRAAFRERLGVPEP